MTISEIKEKSIEKLKEKMDLILDGLKNDRFDVALLEMTHLFVSLLIAVSIDAADKEGIPPEKFISSYCAMIGNTASRMMQKYLEPEASA